MMLRVRFQIESYLNIFFLIESKAMAGFKKFTELSLTLMEAKTKDLGIESHLSERVK